MIEQLANLTIPVVGVVLTDVQQADLYDAPRSLTSSVVPGQN